MAFSHLGLTDELVKSVLATGYNVPTEIQTRAIPHAIAGKDIIGCAQTGTGKTAAFALPILQRFIEHPTPAGATAVRALVLVPTRELAQQVMDFFANYARFTSLQTAAIFGGVGMEPQIKRLRRGVDVVVATPGRLLDHLQRRTVDLSKVEILVLDEADRMLDMGFIHDVKRIIARVPNERQTLLFSATMSDEVKALASSVQKDPEIIEVGERRQPVETVTQQFYRVPKEKKLAFLMFLLQDEGLSSVLVFTRTKHGADKIARRLQRSGIRCSALHSNRTQSQREQALAGFRNGAFNVLIATDIVARGIDVEGISHVINYDTPAFAEDYIHRIGRTGRAEAAGTALTFVAEDEMKNLRAIERFTGSRVSLQAPVAYHEMPEIAQPRSADGGEERGGSRRRHGSRGRRSSGRDRRPAPDHATTHPVQHAHRPDETAPHAPQHDRHSGDGAPAQEHRPEHPAEHPAQAHPQQHHRPQSSGRDERRHDQRQHQGDRHQGQRHSSSRPGDRNRGPKQPSAPRGDRNRGQQGNRPHDRRDAKRDAAQESKASKPSNLPSREKRAAAESDWRKLLAEREQGVTGWRKRLRDLFKRS